MRSDLGLEVAGLAAVKAVVEAVLAEADLVPPLAEAAEFVALALDLFVVTLGTDVSFSHSPEGYRESVKMKSAKRGT